MDNETSARAGERTIRVFISSTFRDMHAQRVGAEFRIVLRTPLKRTRVPVIEPEIRIPA